MPAGNHFFFLILLFPILISCHQNQPLNEGTFQSGIDSLRSEISELKKLILKKDSIITEKDNVRTEKITIAEKKQEVKKEIAPKPQTPKIEKKTNESDTIKHLYVNGKTSVLITPWKDGRRLYFFYDLYGNQTFDLEEVQLSYTVGIHLSFHPNGAVKTANIHTNPGASRYWYESDITFSTTNDPLLMYSRQMPPDHLDIEEQKPYFWNKRTKQWKKQEIVKETIEPPKQ